MYLKSVKINNLLFPDRNNYPFCLDIFNNTGNINFTSPITFFCGENGSGKSTLLTAIAKKCGFNWIKGFERQRYSYNRYEDMLSDFLDIAWDTGPVPGTFFAAEIFRNFAQILDEWSRNDPGLLKYFGGESLMTKSHGESHIAFFRNRFKVKGLYFLDEPETALSPKNQLELSLLLKEYSKTGNSQFVISTHSPFLLSIEDAVLYNFEGMSIARTAYENTTNNNVYLNFFRNRNK